MFIKVLKTNINNNLLWLILKAIPDMILSKERAKARYNDSKVERFLE